MNAGQSGHTAPLYSPAHDRHAIFEQHAALSMKFDQLCSDLACPKLARAYGSDFQHDDTDAHSLFNDSCDDSGPKKGSLRVFAQQVVEKVSQKGCTTYQSIADELINELQQHRRQHGEAPVTPAPKRRKTAAADVEDDGEKNVRRRVYDSLNVLKAVGAVIPLRNLTGSACKEVVWAGLPPSPQELQAAADMQDELKMRAREVQQMQEQLQDLMKQHQLLCQLISRNSRLRQEGSHCDDEAVIPLPFVLLQCSADAIMDVQLSRDEHSAVLDFGSKPFQVVEDYVCLEQLLSGEHDVPLQQYQSVQ